LNQKFALIPDNAQIFLTIIDIPYTINILYGIISDAVPICGSFRKSYILIFGVIHLFCILTLFILGDDNTDKTLVSLMTVGSLCHSWIDTCTNALICEYSRKDMITGS
jgi:hypothetical protein